MLKKFLFGLVLAGCVGAVNAQRGVPAAPAGSTSLGSGLTLADTSAAEAKCVPDASAPGGYRMTLRWLYWRVYTRPTGKTSIGAVQVCWNKCKGAEHLHPSECIEGGCYTKCTDKHLVTLDSSRSTETTVSVSDAISQAIEHCVEVGAEFGVEAGPITAGLNGKASKTTSESRSLEKSVSAAMGASQTGTVNIDVEHFADACCLKATRVYGFYQYEVRLIVQVKEQDYYCDSWVIGLGKAGVLPGGTLKTLGSTRALGQPEDFLLATYLIPSNEPLDEKREPICKCAPKPVITPGGDNDGDGDGSGPTDEQSSLPKGTSRFMVTPKDDEQVVVRNPYNGAILVEIGRIRTTLDPGKEVKVPQGGTRSVVIRNSKNDVLMGYLVQWKSARTIHQGTGVHITPCPEPGALKDFAWPKFLVSGPTNGGTDVSTAALPTWLQGQISGVKVGDFGTSVLPSLGGTGSSLVQVEGNWPTGSVVRSSGGPGQTILEVRQADTVRRAYTRFANLGSGQSTKLEVVNPNGQVVGTANCTVQPVGFATSTSPETGKVGTPATMTVNCQAVLAVLELDGIDTKGALRLNFDYGQSGGASGPKSAPVPSNGIVKVKVRRGSETGAFGIGIAMAFQ